MSKQKRMSKGEKHIAKILDKFHIEYEFNKSTSWSNRKRYDFIIEKYKVVLEVNGSQHYRETYFFNTTIEDQIENDNLKRKMAEENGYDYIELDYDNSDHTSLHYDFNLKFLQVYVLSKHPKEIALHMRKIKCLEPIKIVEMFSPHKTLLDYLFGNISQDKLYTKMGEIFNSQIIGGRDYWLKFSDIYEICEWALTKLQKSTIINRQIDVLDLIYKFVLDTGKNVKTFPHQCDPYFVEIFTIAMLLCKFQFYTTKELAEERLCYFNVTLN